MVQPKMLANFKSNCTIIVPSEEYSLQSENQIIKIKFWNKQQKKKKKKKRMTMKTFNRKYFYDANGGRHRLRQSTENNNEIKIIKPTNGPKQIDNEQFSI